MHNYRVCTLLDLMQFQMVVHNGCPQQQLLIIKSVQCLIRGIILVQFLSIFSTFCEESPFNILMLLKTYSSLLPTREKYDERDGFSTILEELTRKVRVSATAVYNPHHQSIMLSICQKRIFYY